MNLFRLGYFVLGGILAVGTILTGNGNLSKEDRNIYDRAISLTPEMKELGFDDFALEDIKVRFNYDQYDYVIRQGDLTKERAVIQALVATAMDVEGEAQVIVPAYRNLNDLLNLLEAAESVSNGTTVFGKDSYSEEAHVVTIWHEAFHAWQLKHGLEQAIEEWQKEVPDVSIGDDGADDVGYTPESVVTEEIDTDIRVRALFEEEVSLFRDAYYAEDDETCINKVREAFAVMGERRTLMSERAIVVETYLTSVEGIARYVEAEAYRRLAGSVFWNEQYMDTFSYSNGNGKYYVEGMWICYLLDRLMPDWQRLYAMQDIYDLLRGATDT